MAGAPNQRLVGQQGSRARLGTPALLLEIDAFGRNLQAMADHTRRAGIGLRPHCKGHKSLEIAHRQVALGALGISCATLAEAETMAGAGIAGVLITSPITNPQMIERLMELNLAATGALLVAVDHPRNLAALDRAAEANGKALAVVVDYDVGQGRTGGVSEDAAIDLARQAAAATHLRYAGVQAYYGHLQHIAAASDRQRAIEPQQRRIKALCDGLGAAELAPEIVTGGGTGSYAIDCASGIFTEIQPGSYPFLDREYREIEMPSPGQSPFEAALFVQASVVSLNRPGRAIVNAGYKSFATEGGPPLLVTPKLAGAVYEFMGDEHGLLRFEDGAALNLGDVVEFLVPHCDPTINLYEWYHCVRGDTLVDLWRVNARSR